MKYSLRTQWFKDKQTYLIIFLIPFCIMFLAYGFFGVHPFGDESVLVLDLNAQYVYYYEAFRDAFWGDGSFIYSWSRNLSGEMFGIFGYYLASPFSIIPILLPREIMTYSIELMELCKLGACAVTFAFFLKTRRTSKTFTLFIFSSMYALCGYAVVQLMNPMWIDGLIYLPLIFVGVEKLIEKGKMFPLVLPLGLMFIANYYIGYMVGILTAFYFLYYFFFIDERPEKKKTIAIFVKFAISAIVAILFAAVVLYPVYNSLQLGKFDFSTPNFSLTAQFELVDMFTMLMPFSYDTVRPEGLPFIYSGVLTIILVPLYFMNKNIKTRQKICNGLFLALLITIMYVKPLDMAMHGFQTPNWLPFRYSFIFSFLLVVMAAQSFERIEGISIKQLGGVFFGALAFVVYIESERLDHIQPFEAILVSIIFLAIYFGALYLIKKGKSYNIKASLLILVCCELFLVTLKTVVDIDSDVVYSNYSSYVGYIETGREMVDLVEEQDDSLFRMEKTFQRTVNDAMAFGMKGITHSSSTMNAKAIDFLAELGYANRGHYTKYRGQTMLTDDILGIKYIGSKTSEDFNYDQFLSYQDIVVYENADALPIGYMADDAIRNVILSGDNPFINQNSLLSALVSSEQKSYFNHIKIDDIFYNNLTVSNYSGHDKYVPTSSEGNSSIIMTITAPNDQQIYAYFPASYERKVNIKVNGESNGVYFETENYCIISLGRFSEGETIEFEMELTDDELFMKDQYFYYLDEDLLAQDVATLAEGGWNITNFTETYLEGEITAKENQVMFTTIPYEEGWTIKVDGVEVEPIMLADAMIGIEVPEGTHTVTMKFLPDYFLLGIAVSAFGLILVVAIFFIDKKREKTLLKILHDEKADVEKPLVASQNDITSVEKLILDSLSSDSENLTTINLAETNEEEIDEDDDDEQEDIDLDKEDDEDDEDKV